MAREGAVRVVAARARAARARAVGAVVARVGVAREVAVVAVVVVARGAEAVRGMVATARGDVVAVRDMAAPVAAVMGQGRSGSRLIRWSRPLRRFCPCQDSPLHLRPESFEPDFLTSGSHV